MISRKQNHIGSAKSHMVTKIPTALLHETVESVLQRFQDPSAYFDMVEYIYVLDSDRHLDGVVSIRELLNAKNSDIIENIMQKNIASVHLDTHQKKIAHMAIQHGLKAMPVVDEFQRLVGAVPSEVIFNIMRWEHTADMLRLAGIHGKEENMRTFMKAGAVRMARMRIPSLLIGLVGGLMATSIMNFFESALEKNLMLAFFIPLIVYMNDAVGTQTETLLVRSLAINDIKVGWYILREFLIGICIGAVVASTLFVAILLIYHSMALALTIATAMFLGVSTATLLAMAVPYTLFLLGKDPAISGGPFTTILQDILSLVIYFVVAGIFLT